MKYASHFGPWPRKTANGLPTLWLFTDSRVPVNLDRLPRGAGVVLRDYDLPGRAVWAKAQIRAGHARGLVMLLAGDAKLAMALGADGVHVPEQRVRPLRRPHKRFLLTASAHGFMARQRARQFDGIFLSPVFATRSHPGALPLGRLRAALLTRKTSAKIFALGGITPSSAKILAALGFSGLAAIDGWSRE